MKENAKAYLESIVSPLARSGVEVIVEDMPAKPDEPRFLGITMIVVTKERSDAGALVGQQGSHVDAIRTMMRTWAGVNTSPVVHIDLMVANHGRIRTEYV